MYADHISYHALRQPRATAITLSARDVSYAAFDADINKMARGLAPLLPQTGRIAVCIMQPYAHWLVVLALARLGRVSLSVINERHLPLLAPDAVVTNRPVVGGEGMPTVELSPASGRAILRSQSPEPLEEKPRPEDPARIVAIPGRDGALKTILLSHQLIIRRIKAGVIGQTMQFDDKVLCSLSIETFGGFCFPLSTWWFGGNVCLFPPTYEVLSARQVNGLVLAPRELQSLLQTIPADAKPLRHLTVTVAGSPLPKELADDAQQRLSPNLIGSYGFAETNVVAVFPAQLRDKEPEPAGFIVPGIELEIVDGRGDPVPAETIGNLRIRCYEMVEGYLDDDGPGAGAFRGGWFYPDEHGCLSEMGMLRVFSR